MSWGISRMRLKSPRLPYVKEDKTRACRRISQKSWILAHPTPSSENFIMARSIFRKRLDTDQCLVRFLAWAGRENTQVNNPLYSPQHNSFLHLVLYAIASSIEVACSHSREQYTPIQSKNGKAQRRYLLLEHTMNIRRQLRHVSEKLNKQKGGIEELEIFPSSSERLSHVLS